MIYWQLLKQIAKHLFKGFVKGNSNNWLMLFTGLAFFNMAKD